LEEDIKAWLESDRSATHEYFGRGRYLGFSIFETLGYAYRQLVPAEHSVEKRLRQFWGEIPMDDFLAEFRRRLLLDWSADSIGRDPRDFPESRAEGKGGPGVTACRYMKWMGVAYSAAD
jgi:hypothetical protein